MEDQGKLELLQEMYQQWPFFSVTLDMVEMVMAKSDPRVAQFYEASLVDKELWGLGDELRAKYSQTKTALLRVRELHSCIFPLLPWPSVICMSRG